MFGSTMTYTDYRGLAITFLLIYPLGVPVFFFVTLWIENKVRGLFVGDTHEPDPELGEELGFLYAGYDNAYWWWESVDLGRKLMLTGVITFIRPGTTVQLFVAVLLAQFFIVAYARQKPYFKDEDDNLQLISQLQIWFTALAGLAVKFSTLVTSIDPIEAASAGNDYESYAFDCIMVIASVTPLLLAIGQLADEAYRMFHKMYVLDVAGALRQLRLDAQNASHVLEKGADQQQQQEQGDSSSSASVLLTTTKKKKNPLGLGEGTLRILNKPKTQNKSKKVLV
jgi:hypothetical protein